MEHIKLGDTVRFGVVTHNVSGLLVNADETPRWNVFENVSDTPILQGDFTQRTGYVGTYRATFTPSGSWIFTEGNYYEVHASGKVNGVVGRDIVRSFVLGDLYDCNVKQVSGTSVVLKDFHAPPTGIANAVWTDIYTNYSGVSESFGSGLYEMIRDRNVYYADIEFVKDDGEDEYAIQWYRNGSLLSSGDISEISFNVKDVQTGNTLFDVNTSNGLSYASATLALLRHTQTQNLIGSGSVYISTAHALIDGGTRKWSNLLGLDK